MPSTSVQSDMDRAADAPEGCTLWFRSDLRKFDGNVFTTDTPFGRASIAGIGNVFKERDHLEETVESLLEALKQAEGFMAGSLEDEPSNPWQATLRNVRAAIAKATTPNPGNPLSQGGNNG